MCLVRLKVAMSYNSGGSRSRKTSKIYMEIQVRLNSFVHLAMWWQKCKTRSLTRLLKFSLTIRRFFSHSQYVLKVWYDQCDNLFGFFVLWFEIMIIQTRWWEITEGVCICWVILQCCRYENHAIQKEKREVKRKYLHRACSIWPKFSFEATWLENICTL